MLKQYRAKKRAGDGLRENIMDMFFDKVIGKFILLAIFYGILVSEFFHWVLKTDNYFFWALAIFILYILKIIIFDWKKIKIDLENKKKGMIGEVFTGDFLQENFKNENSKIINDLVLENSGKKFNIDHILINKKGVFIIETKNQNNWKGHESQQYSKWIIQVKAQINNIKKITGNENIFGMVVRPDVGNRKNSNFEIPIINQKFIKSFIEKKENIFSKEEIDDIYYKIENNKK